MTERIIIPTDNQEGINANLAQHFGRASYFVVVELDENKAIVEVSTISNTSEHTGGMGHAHDNILCLKPTALIVYGMGPRGIIGFQNAGVKVLKATSDTVKEVIEDYKKGQLELLTEGCEQAHHR